METTRLQNKATLFCIITFGLLMVVLFLLQLGRDAENISADIELTKKEFFNVGQDINEETKVLNIVFNKGRITKGDKLGEYEVAGDDRVAYDVVDNSVINKKIVEVRVANIDLNRDRNEEKIVFSRVRFLGQTCTACGTKLYIDVLNRDFEIQNGQVFEAHDNDLFFSSFDDILNLQLVDVNDDGVGEIYMTYRTDNLIGLDEEKVAILQWQEDHFEVSFQQRVHINMDHYGRLQEADKINFDAKISFAKTLGDYPDIIVDKKILKKAGMKFDLPLEERSVFGWSVQNMRYELSTTRK